MDKQIERMAKVLGDGRMTNCSYYESCSACPCDFNCIFQENAQVLLTAGYRRASDVALETVDSFQRKLRHIFLNMCDGNDYERLNLLQIDGAIEALYDSYIAELKKKYTEDTE